MVIMTKKRFRQELDKAADQARVDAWKEHRIDEIDNDVSDMAERIKTLENRADSAGSSLQSIWRQLDDIKDQLSRILKCN